MKIKNYKYTYQIVNSHVENNFLNQSHISCNFISIIHTFLKCVYENILLLQTYNVHVFDMSHMWINKMLNHEYSNILHDKIYFNLDQCELYYYVNNDDSSNVPSKLILPNILGINILISYIKNAILKKNIVNNLNHIHKKNIHVDVIKSQNNTTNIQNDLTNIYIEKQKMHNEIHKKSNSVDPIVIIQNNKNDNIKKLLKEKNDEKKRIFISDLSVYTNIKKDLNDKIIEEIPPLFMNKFLIFKLLDEDNLLNSDNNYALFMAMYESDNESNNDIDDDINNPINKNEFENNIDINNLFNGNNINV